MYITYCGQCKKELDNVDFKLKTDNTYKKTCLKCDSKYIIKKPRNIKKLENVENIESRNIEKFKSLENENIESEIKYKYEYDNNFWYYMIGGLVFLGLSNLNSFVNLELIGNIKSSKNIEIYK